MAWGSHGLGFLLELAGKGAARQRNGTQVNKSYKVWPGAVGVIIHGGEFDRDPPAALSIAGPGAGP